LDLGLVAAFRAESSMGLDAIGFTLVLGVAPESVSESNPDTDDDDCGSGSGFFGAGFFSVTGVDGKEEAFSASASSSSSDEDDPSSSSDEASSSSEEEAAGGSSR
jgi:hypothetical protein